MCRADGDEAVAAAQASADRFGSKGDAAGRAVWLRIVTAVRELRRLQGLVEI